MSERQRNKPASAGGNPNTDNSGDGAESANMDDMRTLADRLMANAERSLSRLGMGSATEFLDATRQSGGQ